MTREEGIEAIKRHLEAIASIAMILGTDDYLVLAVQGDSLSFNNGPAQKRVEEDRIHVYRINGAWHELKLI